MTDPRVSARRFIFWLRGYFAGALATLLVEAMLVVVYVLVALLLENGRGDWVSRWFVLQDDWTAARGPQWAAVFTNGFVTFEIAELARIMLIVLVTLPWLERRLGTWTALGVVLSLAWILGPVKIILGGPGSVGTSKFILTLQTYWWAFNPILLALSQRIRAPVWRRSLALAGWVPAGLFGWRNLVDPNPAHVIAVSVGASLAILDHYRWTRKTDAVGEADVA